MENNRVWLKKTNIPISKSTSELWSIVMVKLSAVVWHLLLSTVFELEDWLIDRCETWCQYFLRIPDLGHCMLLSLMSLLDTLIEFVIWNEWTHERVHYTRDKAFWFILFEVSASQSICSFNMWGNTWRKDMVKVILDSEKHWKGSEMLDRDY